MRIYGFLFLGLSMILFFSACQKEQLTPCPSCPEEDLVAITYNPQSYELQLPEWLPIPILPEDNPLTVEGVALGRHLFYDPIMSSDSTMSCFSCHQQEKGFTNGTAQSTGVLGLSTSRSSMSLTNLVFYDNYFTWDGHAQTIEEIALVAVELPVELNESWPNVLAKLRRSDRYPPLFRQAFGVERRSEMTEAMAAKAIAQFIRTLTSGNARFDRVVWLNDGWLTESEERGRRLFFFEQLDQSEQHPGCSHCHFNPLYTNHDFKNNGIEDVATLADFPDNGRGAITQNQYDNGKFRVPTLRNIIATAPYMHDGRYATLEEVLDHYSSGGHGAINEDVNIQPFTLSEQQKQDMINFLKTLTDEDFLSNPAYGNPFQD